MAMKAIVTGDAKLDARLAELAGPKAKAVIRKAARAALAPTLAAARRNAPFQSGKLRKSIKLRAIERSRQYIGVRVTTGGEVRKRRKQSSVAGDDFYGAFIEYGWKAGRRVRNSDIGLAKSKRRTAAQVSTAAKRNGSRRQVPGQHYMKRAADATKQFALEIYAHEIDKGVTQIATGG